MDVLTTRSLSYTDDNGEPREVVLTVFMPFEAETDWRVGFVFSPPIQRRIMYGRAGDALQALIYSLGIARAYLESTDLFRRLHWQGMVDCGLVDVAERPASWAPPDVPQPEDNPGTLDAFSTRTLGCPDETGVERELLLTIFIPFKAEGGTWKCGVAFGPPRSTPIRYGVGDDFLEAFLNGVAMARVIFDQMRPVGWEPSRELDCCSHLPYQIGRTYWMDPSPKDPSRPDFSER